MRKISDAQVEAIMKDLLILNIPVKSYLGIQDMFEKLPVVDDKDENTSN